MHTPSFLQTLIFLTVFTGHASAQLTLGASNVFPPNVITPCSGEYPYGLMFQNNSPDTIFDVQFSYHFFEHGEYVPGSVSGAGEADIINLNEPAFFIGAVPPGVWEVTFSGQAGCDAVSTPSPAHDVISTSYSGDTFTINGPSYNIRKPALAFTELAPLSYNGAPNTSFTQLVCVRNEGFGPIHELFVTYGYEPGIVRVSQTSVGQIITPPGLSPAVIQLGASDFSAFGNGNPVFETGEEVCIELTIGLLSCGQSAIAITAGWGCDGVICEGITANGTVGVSSLNPSFVSKVEELQHATLCENGFVVLSLTNNQNEGGFPGSAAALDLILRPSFNGLSEASACVSLLNFRIGDSLILPNPIINFYQLDLTTLAFDPDGTGGLSDIDGDGFFDDLAAGDTIFLAMEMAIDAACIPECNSFYRYLRLQANYKNQCGAPRSNFFNLTTVHYQFGATGNVQFQPEYLNNTIIDANFNLSFSSSGGLECPEASFRLIFELPEALALTPGFAPTLSGQPVPWSVSGNTLVITPSGMPSQGILNMQFETACQPVEFEPGAPCPIRTNNLKFYTIEYRMEMYCGSFGCTSPPLTVLCETSGPFIVTCPFPPVGPGGVQIDGFSVQRLSLGWADATMSQRADFNTPGLALHRAMPHDTVLLTAPAAVFDEGMENLRLSISYFANQEWLRFISAELAFFDYETGASLTCTGLAVDTSPIDGFQQIIIPLSALFAAGACFDGWNLSANDRFVCRVLVEVTENIPIALTNVPGLTAGYNFDWNGNALSCNAEPAVLEVLRPRAATSITFRRPTVGCDTLTVVHQLPQYLLGTDNEDPFPSEYRPFALRDSIEFTLPQGWVFIPNSARVTYEDREGNTSFGPVLLYATPIPDPDEVLENGQTKLVFPGPFPAVDLVDLVTFNELTFQVLPSCLPAQTPQTPQYYYYQEYAYAPGYTSLERYYYNSIAGYYAGLRDLQAINVFPQEQNGAATWSFNLNYRSSNIAIPFAFLIFELPEGVTAFELREIVDLNTTIVHPLLPFGPDNDVWAHIGQLPAYSTRKFELVVTGGICEPGTVVVRSGFQCGGYPESPDLLDTDCQPPFVQRELFLNPRNAGLDLILAELPQEPIPLCEELAYTIQGSNLGEGSAEALQGFIILPPDGITILPGSSEFSLDGQNWAPISGPTPVPGSPNTWIWDSLSLPDGGLHGREDSPDNVFFIRFRLNTNCDYVAGSQFIVGAGWRNGCGSEGRVEFAAPPLELLGAPVLNNYIMDVAASNDGGFLACTGNTDLHIRLFSLPSNVPTSQGERIFLYLPEGIFYENGSVQDILNMAALGEPIVNQQGNRQMLEWEMPLGLPPGQWMEFSIGLNLPSPNVLPCDEISLSLAVANVAGIPCATAPQGLCAIEFFESEQAFSLPVVRPVYELDQVVATSVENGQGGETVTFSAEIRSLAESAGAEMLTLAIYHDTNGSGSFEMDEDSWLGDTPVNISGLLPGETMLLMFSLDVPPNYTCDGYILAIVPESNPCLCTLASVFVPAPPIALITRAEVVCFGEPLILGGAPNPGYSYHWESPNVSSPSDANPVYLLAGLASGQTFTEYIPVVITRPPGCVAVDTMAVTTVRLGLGLSAVTDFNGYPLSCPGASDAEVVATPAGGSPPYSYSWNAGLPPIAGHSGLGAGTYSVTLADSNACTAVESLSLNAPPALSLSVQESDFNGYGVSCYGSRDGWVQVVVSGGAPLAGGSYAYLWSNGATTEALESLSPGMYSVTVSDANACYLVGSITLGEPLPLEIEAQASQPLCEVDSSGAITLQASGGVAPYLASPWGSVFEDFTHQQGLPAGDYAFLVEDANGCVDSSSVTIELSNSVFSTSISHLSCHGSNDGSICIEAETVYGGGFTVSWPDGQTGNCALGLAAGNYAATVTDGNGCQQLFETRVEEPSLLAVDFTVVDNHCYGDSDGIIVSHPQGGRPPYSFRWGDNNSASDLHGLRAGIYQLTLTDEGGCIWTGNTSVSEPPILLVQALSMPVTCQGDSDGTAQAIASGGSPPYRFHWNTGQETSVADNLPAGHYSVTVTDTFNCTASAEASIEEPAPLEAQWEVDTPLCPGETNGAIFIGHPSSNDWQYSLEGSPYQSESWFGSLAPGSYRLSILNGVGCEVLFDITVPDPPELEASFELWANNSRVPIQGYPAFAIIESGDSVIIRIISNDPGVTHIKWMNGDVPCDTCREIIVRPLVEMAYKVVAINENGCLAEASLKILVSKKHQLYIPNAFSPNGDGNNDLFRIYARPGSVKQVQYLYIFNRWGSLVFKQEYFPPDDPSAGWNGILEYSPAPVGVYTWTAKVEYSDGSTELLSGDVLLSR